MMASHLLAHIPYIIGICETVINVVSFLRTPLFLAQRRGDDHISRVDHVKEDPLGTD